MSDEEETQIERIIRRLDRIEARLDALRPNNTNTIVLDKELDRVLEKKAMLKATYASHQRWSEDDRQLFTKLKAREKELKALLGVKY